MNWLFYSSSAIAIVATILCVSRSNAVHGLLYLIVSFFGIAVMMVSLGAAFAAALEIIVYAGAIMTLFVFVIMLIPPGADQSDPDSPRRLKTAFFWPAVPAGILLAELVYACVWGDLRGAAGHTVGAKEVGMNLFGPYVLAVELASLLLLAGLVGAYHLGRRTDREGMK